MVDKTRSGWASCGAIRLVEAGHGVIISGQAQAKYGAGRGGIRQGMIALGASGFGEASPVRFGSGKAWMNYIKSGHVMARSGTARSDTVRCGEM